MFCKYCGKQLADDSVFCSACGKKLIEDINDTIVSDQCFESETNILNKLISDFELIRVDGGEFMMGATPEQDASGFFSDRKPVHLVRLDTFYIGAYPVTQDLWEAVMYYNNSSNKGSRYPVTNITRLEVKDFLTRLTEATGFLFRLPTEAEWEFAARGGIYSKGYKYPGSNNVNEVAWYKSNSGKQTHPVGEKLPNELGLYDMAGNVLEFCSDVYESGYYKKSPTYNPTGPTAKGVLSSVLTSASEFVCRGCSYYFDNDAATSSYRYYAGPGAYDDNLGFRYVVEIPQ